MSINYTESEIRELIDEDSAVDLLSKKSVENPSESLDHYIRSIPDLLRWYEKEGRDYPWRRSRNTWEILIAEILLQRTRADAVSEVYPKFIEKYDTPESLYQADEKDIRDHIETLGLVNSRLKTLESISGLLVKQFNGQMPEDIEELNQCWRIGPYVVRAVKIFARDEPTALVDSNIARIINRLFGLDLSSQHHKDDDFYDLMSYLTPKEPYRPWCISLYAGKPRP